MTNDNDVPELHNEFDEGPPTWRSPYVRMIDLVYPQQQQEQHSEARQQVG